MLLEPGRQDFNMARTGLSKILDSMRKLLPFGSGRSSVRHSDISRLLEQWIDNGRYSEEASVETVASQMGIAPWMLTDYFRDVHGKRFTTWRKEIRLSKAADLLVEKPEIPASKIGMMVGIRDKSNFRNQFRLATGMTPAQWREIGRAHV